MYPLHKHNFFISGNIIDDQKQDLADKDKNIDRQKETLKKLYEVMPQGE